MVVRGIAPAESDLAIRKGEQAVVGDSHAMGVATEILHDVFGATEGAFQVHHPVVSIEWPEPSGEGLRFCKKLQVSVEVQLSVLKGLLESVDELAAKQRRWEHDVRNACTHRDDRREQQYDTAQWLAAL